MTYRVASDPSRPWNTPAIAAAVLLAWCLAAAPLAAQAEAEGEHWVGTWATALVPRNAPQPPQLANPPTASMGGFVPIPVLNPGVHFNDQTLRQIVHTSVGGDRARVVFSNVFGTKPLAIGAASVAIRREEAAVVPSTVQALQFDGRSSTTIPAGAVVVSDPVALDVPALSDLAIDLYLPGDTAMWGSPVTAHQRGEQTNYVSSTGNHAGVTDLPVETETESWFFLARVEVDAAPATGVVVALGDSITDGYGSTRDAHSTWPDHLARRFRAAGIDMAVLNVGIGGNRVLSGGSTSALARFDRDVLSQTGVTHVIVLQGINDIGLPGIGRSGDPPPSAEELIAGHRQLIVRAHARGLEIYGATLTPFEGTTIPGYWTAEGEVTRQRFNQWIRTSGEYDGVIDFDAATLDPTTPLRFLPRYDYGDHLHPGDAGYEAMANAVDLDLFKAHRAATATAR